MVHIERLLIADADIEIPPVGAAGSVASLIGPLPIDPGHWTLKAEIKGETGALRAERIEFESGTDDSVHARVDGSISDLEKLISRAERHPRV